MRDAQPDYSIRDEALLRIFCLWVLPTAEALAYLDRDQSEYVRRLENIEKALANKDWAANPTTRASRLTIEFGQRFYTMRIEWIDWAATQIAAGTLQPGGPLPPAPWPAD